jgi:U3 small nucleolar RNA-associated protein 22
MRPFATKRRKLDHDLTSLDGSESEGNSPQGASVRDSTKEPPPSSKTIRAKRTLDDDDGALYAGGLYKSSLFELQVHELLREVQPNYEKRFRGLNDALHRLKGLIEGIEERNALSVSREIHSVK